MAEPPAGQTVLVTLRQKGEPAAAPPAQSAPSIAASWAPPEPGSRDERLGVALQRGHVLRRPEGYRAMARRRAWAVGGVALAPLLGLAAATLPGLAAPTIWAWAGAVALPLGLASATYGLALGWPVARAVLRARDIDAKLPYALNYLSTLAASGATPQTLFASLARQPLYGAVAQEAARLTRDIDLLGCDVVTAMARAGERTASARWQDLLQGAITSLTSGGDLRTYFRDKAEQFLHDNRHEQKRFLEGLGVLAECFVTVVVAAPLFLIVILSVMTSLGGSVSQTVLIGYTLVLVVLPLAQAGFVLTIRTMTPEA